MLLFHCNFCIIVTESLCLLSAACSSSCPVLECWFVQEKAGRGGGLTAATSQEKSLLHIRTDPNSHSADSLKVPADINPDRVYFITGEFNMKHWAACRTTCLFRCGWWLVYTELPVYTGYHFVCMCVGPCKMQGSVLFSFLYRIVLWNPVVTPSLPHT